MPNKYSKYEIVNLYNGFWAVRFYSPSEKKWWYLKARPRKDCGGVFTKSKEQARPYEYGTAIEILKEYIGRSPHIVHKITATF